MKSQRNRYLLALSIAGHPSNHIAADVAAPAGSLDPPNAIRPRHRI